MSKLHYLPGVMPLTKIVLIFFATMLSACSVDAPEELGSARDISDHPGASIYYQQCASCHGNQAEGLAAWALNDATHSTDLLSNLISDTMPPSNISGCVDTCATDVADYIVSELLQAPDEDNRGASDDDTNPEELDSFYAQFIEADIVQAKCALCHNSNGIAQETSLILNIGNDQATYNQNAFSNYYYADANGHANLLSKVRGGSAHGGGVQLACDDDAFKKLEDFLQLLGANEAPGDLICSDSLFDGVSLTNSRETLRRAALIIAGRLPTDNEYTLAQSDDSTLRSTIKALMTGDNFHEFLIRGANDKLLTKALAGDGDLKFADRHDVHYPELSNRSYDSNIATLAGDENAASEFISLLNGFRYAGAMAPLKLVAYIVENDRPYTEILSADYTMVNPDSNIIFNANAAFDNINDLTTFKPGKNQGQILENNETVVIREDKAIGPQITSHGGFIDYPHAGLLNDMALLNRYPSTDTNRNRGRARFNYYHFLNFDIEKSAARTTDPDDLADTNNPTLNNPACTVCHTVMDPVAGAFQNYDDSGHYRGATGGLHSLPTSYTKLADSIYQNGDLWYRDMLEPGFVTEGSIATAITEQDNTLQVLAQHMISDPRFAQSAVVFWWPSIMSEPLEEAPEQITDSDYQAKLSIYEAQQETVVNLAQQFEAGIDGGSPYNVKDLLTEMIMSQWFRAKSVDTSLNTDSETSLASIGIGRLLTPEELALKIKALTGLAWGETTDDSRFDPNYDKLKDQFTTYYGGIDSFGITTRATELTALMSNVALAQALEMSCPTVIMDFNRSTDDRNIFKNISKHSTPLTEAQVQIDIDQQNTTSVFNQELLVTNTGAKTLRFNINNPSGSGNQNSRRIFIDKFELQAPNGTIVLTLEGENLITSGGIAIDHDGDIAGGINNDNDITSWAFTSGYLEVPVTLESLGTYQITVYAYGNTLSDGIHPQLSTSINNLEAFSGSAGETLIKNQLKEMHATFLGEELAIDSEELNETYLLFVSTWQNRWASDTDFNVQASTEETCTAPEGITFSDDDLVDPQHMLASWSRMMLFFMTDYKFLHE